MATEKVAGGIVVGDADTIARSQRDFLAVVGSYFEGEEVDVGCCMFPEELCDDIAGDWCHCFPDDDHNLVANEE